MNSSLKPNVLIIGAGPAGLGCAVALRECGIPDVLIVDKQGVGASFEAWPQQMKLLTPSFHSNAFGPVDLNSITPETSPADYLHTQHPSGAQYASYLKAVALRHELRFLHAEVRSLRPVAEGFEVRTNHSVLLPKYVIWAAGEFSYPDDKGILGAEHALHSSRVSDWSLLPGQKFAVVGGAESGVDAAIQLAELGKEVHLLSRGEPWGEHSADPSQTLAPRTLDRLRQCLTGASGSLHFYKNADIVSITPTPGGYELMDTEGTPFLSPTQPILATGFHSSMDRISHLFSWRGRSAILDEETDESIITPGLYYSGPSLVHREAMFCFIYKFRARFGIIARSLAQRLGYEWEKPLKLWRERGFMVEDLACCTDCKCAIEPVESMQPEVVDYAAAA
jgi:putative flavoprotein involved in K+ transport